MDYVFKKTDKAKEFICDECGKKKKSKNTASNGKRTICNGYYGELLSKNEISKQA